MKKELLICGLFSTLSSINNTFATQPQMSHHQNTNQISELINSNFNGFLFSKALSELSRLLDKNDNYEFNDNEVKEIYKQINILKFQLKLISDQSFKQYNTNLVIEVLKGGELLSVTADGQIVADQSFLDRLEELGIVQDEPVSTYSTICI